MAPRRSRTAKTATAEPLANPSASDPNQLSMLPETPPILQAPADLIAEYHQINNWANGELKKFNEFMQPHRDRMEAIKAELHRQMLASKVNGFPTDNGTAYISEIISHKIDAEKGDPWIDPATGEIISTGREALLDWALANWDEFGSEGLLINISKAVVDKWREAHEGKPPPGLVMDTMLRVNINKA